MTRNSNSSIDLSDGQDSWSANSMSESSDEADSDIETPTEAESNGEHSFDDDDWGAVESRQEANVDVIKEEAKVITEETPDSADRELVDEEKKEEPDVDEFVELGVVQVNYTTRTLQNSEQERAVIHLFCRVPESCTSDKVEQDQLIRVDVHNFKPYFYAPPNEVRDINPHSDDRFADKTRIDSDGNTFESIRGQELTRVDAYIPRTVGKIRDDYDHYEADVLFPDRFMIDKGIKSGIRVPADVNDDGVISVPHDCVEAADVDANPRIHNVDIEVNDRNGFPEAEDAEEPVLCITAHDSWENEYVVWYLDDDRVEGDVPGSVDNYEFIEDDGDRPDIKIETCRSEEELLADYISYLDKTEPDMLVGWNVDEFDAEYLINRLEKLNDGSDRNLNPDRLSRINEVWGGGWRGPNIKGRVVFDLLEAYKRTQFSELDSYRLDAIGEMELGVGKERFDGDIGDLWEDDPERLIEYNLRDVEICVELDEQQDIIGFWDEVRQFVGCRIQDAPIPGDAVDMYVLHKVHGKFVLPSKGTVETGEDYEGGSVFDPITGIEEMVTVLDLKSLYPMCMCTINASPETKVDPDNYNGDTFTAPNGVHYKKDEDGIIREMVNELLSERERKKELRSQYEPGDDKYELYDKQQGAVKVIMNSLYGTLGWDRFRLYDKDNAAAVTATGRGVIEFTEETVEEMGYEVAYGDTDSVMISLGDLSNTDAEISDEVREEGPDWDEQQLRELQAGLNQSHDIEDQINEAYNKYARDVLNADEHRFLIEFEKLYKRFLQAGKKKRYGGHIIWKEGKFVDKIDITGFEYQRSDIADITKEGQKRLIEMLVKGEDIDDVRDYLHGLIEDVKNGDVPVEKLGMPSGIGQPLDEYDTETAHVRGAKYANTLFGTNLGQASKPKRVYLDRVHVDFFTHCEEELGLTPQKDPVYRQFKRDPDVICFIHDDQIPDEFEIDTDKMLNKTLQRPLSRVLKAVDLTWEDVKSGQEQTGLENFM